MWLPFRPPSDIRHPAASVPFFVLGDVMIDVQETFVRLSELTEDDTAAAILTLSEAINGVAVQLKHLGNADACTPMGAIEALGSVLKDGLSDVASGLQAISGSLDDAAEVAQ